VTREEVIVDVVATDKRGDCITDLKLEELIHLEGGKHQARSWCAREFPAVWELGVDSLRLNNVRQYTGQDDVT
jgi:hypothetical protein